MDFLNIVYKYVNRFINSDQLLKILKEMDRTSFRDNEIKELEELIIAIKKNIKEVPNEIDEIEKRRMASLNRIISSIEKTLETNKLGEEEYAFLKERHASLLKEKKCKRDGGKRYEKIAELLTNSKTYTTYYQSMDDERLLEFITHYISVPLPLEISQETFNNLVNVGIKEDKREALWRLAANYFAYNMDLSLIEDYFINKRDAYYLTELISITEDALNKDELIDKIGQTHDLNFYKEIITKGDYLKDLFTDEQKEKINKIIERDEENERI